MNLRGEFNVENTTSYDQLPCITNDDRMDIDQGNIDDKGELGDVGDEGKLTDDSTKAGKAVSFEAPTTQDPKEDQGIPSADSLYPVFWSLQNFFSNPTRLFVKEAFESFKAGLAATMIKFKAVDEEQMRQGAATRNAEETRAARGNNTSITGEKRKREDLNSHFNPKYLTSRELFELEVGISFPFILR